jgi:exonuclease SbcC
MRILRISLRNIASLAGTHTVDFTREPLRSAGLFSISGPTGAGKSTLLDALCLALYDATPRLDSIGKQARLADGSTQNDARNLLRRGAAEGFAEAVFTGVDGADYTARWSVRRSRNKADGVLQASEMVLYRGHVLPGAAGVIEVGGKKTEVREAIAARLGLTFAQFTRAVLLAQNDFSAFLKADDRERAEILEALTGTERFAALSIAAFARAKSEQEAVMEIEHRLAGNAPLSPEDRGAAEAAKDAAAQVAQSAETLAAQRAEQAKWFQQLHALTQTAAEAESKLEAARRARDDAAPRRAEMEHIRHAAGSATSLRDHEKRTARECHDAEKALAAAQQRHLEAQTKRTAQQQSLAAAKEKLDQSRRAREQAAPQLLRARELDAKLAPLADHAKKAMTAAKDAATKLGTARTEHDAAQAARNQAQTRLEKAGASVQVFAVFRPFTAEAAAWLERIKNAEAAMTAWKAAQSKAGALDEPFQELARNLATERSKESQLRAAVESAKVSLAAAEAASAAQQAAVEMRAALQPGQPCPVCGAAEHPYAIHPPEAPADDNSAPLRNCRRGHDAAVEAFARWEKQVSEMEKQLAVRQTEFQNALDAVQKESGRAADVMQVLEPLLEVLAAVPDAPAFGKDAAAFRRWFDTGTRDCAAAAQSVTRWSAEIEKLSARAEPLGKQVADLENSAQELGSTAAAAVAAHDALKADRAKFFAGRAADAVQQDLDEACARVEALHKISQDEVAATDRECAAAVAALQAAGTAAAATRERSAAAAAALEEWLRAFSSRCGREVDRPALDAMLARDEAWRAAEQRALEALDAAAGRAEGSLKANHEMLEKHRSARPTEENEAAVTAALVEARSAAQEAKDKFSAAAAAIVSDDQRRLQNAALAEELTARRAKADPWQKLNELIGSADGAKFRSLAQQRTLDILLGYANAQLDLLAPRYRLERIQDSLNLITLDRDMADERRSVHSLSGGESFLVSLALALGLASLTSNRLRIESLFIDEGFGSLDTETLNTSMSALMQLEAQGRKVGVISHVAEMADAIPVQIRVLKGRNGASRLEVPGAEPERLTAAAGPEAAVPAGGKPQRTLQP